jgi:hypothetical protein
VVLEGLVTTINPDGTVRVSPMGPHVDQAWDHFVLRPYHTSRTLANLKRTAQGVLHVTDDVELLARAATGQWDSPPATEAACSVDGCVLLDCCRWYEFRVTSSDATQQRAELACRVVATGRRRDFFGFCRAKHAVVEAAILATRVELLPGELLQSELQRLEPLVDKTGGDAERRAFHLLRRHILAGLAPAQRLP